MTAPQNDLERALWAAVRAPEAQPELMRQLRESMITFLTPYHPEVEGDFPITEGMPIQISTWTSASGQVDIPLFTSMARASAALKAVKMGEHRFCIGEMKGELLFEALAKQENPAVLNPECGTPGIVLRAPQMLMLANDGSKE